MVLVDMGTSRVSSTYCKMEVEIASGYAIACLLMRRLMRTDTTLAAPAALKLATFSRSNHLRHNSEPQTRPAVYPLQFVV